MVAFYLRPPLRALVVIPGNSFEYRDGVSPPKCPNVLVFTRTGAGLGRAGPHDLVLALAHLYVSKSSTGCLRPSARPEESIAVENPCRTQLELANNARPGSASFGVTVQRLE